MNDAEKTPNVVVCCSKAGLYEELEDLQKRYFHLFSTSFFDRPSGPKNVTKLS